MTRRKRVARPRAVLSALAAAMTILFGLGLASVEYAAVFLACLTVMALDSIAGSLDRLDELAAAPRWTTRVTPGYGTQITAPDGRSIEDILDDVGYKIEALDELRRRREGKA